jgi:hypothetical protein
MFPDLKQKRWKKDRGKVPPFICQASFLTQITITAPDVFTNLTIFQLFSSAPCAFQWEMLPLINGEKSRLMGFCSWRVSLFAAL